MAVTRLLTDLQRSVSALYGKLAAELLAEPGVCRYRGSMQSNIAARRRYSQQREKKTPPHVSLKTLRLALNKSQTDVTERVHEITGDKLTKGALSAIENGHRGVSAELLTALEMAYGLEPGSITTTYRPRVTPSLIGDEVPA
jgi:hypothetical protein